MPTQLGNTVDFSEAKVIFSSPEAYTHFDAEIRFRLIQALQTTLDLEQLLHIFFDHVQTVVNLEGLSYKLDLLGIELTLGRQSIHTGSYRLITQQDFLGEITFCNNKRFPEKDLAVLENLLNVLVFPLRNAIRHREALSAALEDPLTGAGNRLALNNTLQREIIRAQRYEQSMGVLMIDLDNFKSINDKYGHQTGDEVLRTIVDAMRNEIRGSDVLFRYGGEEFVVLLTSTTLASARYIAERVRSRINGLEIEKNGERIPTSISVGLSMLQPEDSVRRLLERADYAMYCAKNEGRNKVKVCREELA
ncbi:MAG: GGDEF domain-containing protein [Pseudomonadales bacterium]|nr:GGDEF domain-containing protein [Pseudomonadales bacterium]